MLRGGRWRESVGGMWRVEGRGGGDRGVDLLRDSPDYVLQLRAGHTWDNLSGQNIVRDDIKV
jgi:hypothetical protein